MREITDLTWIDMKNVDKEKCSIVIPIASIEQHGHHLPLSTDYLIMDAILHAKNGIMSKEFDNEVIVTPIIPYGLSPEHLEFPGTISLKATTIAALLDDICSSLIKNRFRNYIILNTHGGNSPLLQILTRDLKLKYQKCSFIHFDLYSDYFKMRKVLEGKSIDIHAGEYETSLLMYLYPQLVNMAYSENELRTNLEYLPNSCWFTRDLTTTGVIGDATLASYDKGKELFTHMIGRLEKILKESIDRPRKE